MWTHRSFVKLTSLTRIIEKLAKNASKSPGPVESKPRERIESFSIPFNAICSQKKHTNMKHSFPVSMHSIQFYQQSNRIERNNKYATDAYFGAATEIHRSAGIFLRVLNERILHIEIKHVITAMHAWTVKKKSRRTKGYEVDLSEGRWEAEE